MKEESGHTFIKKEKEDKKKTKHGPATQIYEDKTNQFLRFDGDEQEERG